MLFPVLQPIPLVDQQHHGPHDRLDFPDVAVSPRPQHRDIKETESITAGSVVAAAGRAVLRHAALDRLPHAASGLSQRLPRLLGKLRRALGGSLRRARQTTVAMPGRARAGPS